MTKDKKFLWCAVHQQKRPLAGCPRCGHFPCQGLSPEHLRFLSQSVSLQRAVQALSKRRIKTMFFLKDKQGALSTYQGKLEDLDAARAADIEEALEVSSYFVQELTWVPAGKEPKVKAPAAAKPRPCVVELASGEFTLDELDPAELREDAAKIYPIDKRYLRRFVPVRVAIDEGGTRQKPAAPRKKAAPAP